MRKIMFDFKRVMRQTKPIRDRRNVTWCEFSFQKYMIYPGPDGRATGCFIILTSKQTKKPR